MKETPIIMATEMVKATLEGRRTMTRQTRGLEEINKKPGNWDCIGGDRAWWTFRNKLTGCFVHIKCPYGQVGDRLWVKEPWAVRTDGIDQILYRADYKELVKMLDLPEFNIKWKPSIHMFRKDSRILLEITGLGAERLQEITPEEWRWEGLELVGYEQTKQNFINLWDSLNAKRGYGWDMNPWVWPIGYKILS